MNNEIVLFETKDKEIKLNVKVDQDTVWLSPNEVSSSDFGQIRSLQDVEEL